jgi:hypothetical protein
MPGEQIAGAASRMSTWERGLEKRSSDCARSTRNGVRLLAGVAEELLAQGCSVEQTARHVHGLRRALAEQFKALTPEPWRSSIQAARTVAVHGNETVWCPKVGASQATW